MTEAPDVDLADGNAAPAASGAAAVDWAQPTGVRSQRPGGASTYQVFSTPAASRPDQPALPMMIDMDDPARIAAQKASCCRLHPGEGGASLPRLSVEAPDRRRGESVTLVRTWPRRLDGSDRRHARSASEQRDTFLRGPTISDILQFAARCIDFPDHHGRLRDTTTPEARHCGTVTDDLVSVLVEVPRSYDGGRAK